jgi:hypothetical protein
LSFELWSQARSPARESGYGIDGIEQLLAKPTLNDCKREIQNDPGFVSEPQRPRRPGCQRCSRNGSGTTNAESEVGKQTDKFDRQDPFLRDDSPDTLATTTRDAGKLVLRKEVIEPAKPDTKGNRYCLNVIRSWH